MDNGSQGSGSGTNPVQGQENTGSNDFNIQLAEMQPGKGSQVDSRGAEKTQQTQQTQQQTGADTGNRAQQATTQQTTPAQTSTSSQADLIRSVVEATVGGIRKQEQASRPVAPMTPEDFNKKFRVPVATIEHVQALMDADPKKGAAALTKLLQDAATSGVLMARELFQDEIKSQRDAVEPHIKSWQTYQKELNEQKAEASFYKTYPELSDERELVNEIKDSFVAKVQAGQINFADQSSANKAVAEATKKILARMTTPAQGARTDGGTQQTQASQQQTQQKSRQMASASSAGASGTGQAKAKSDVELIFGSDAR